MKVRCAAPLALLRTRSSAHRPGLTYRRPIRLSAPSLPALLTRRPHTLLLPRQVLHRVEERRRGEEFEREVALLKDLRDRNIVQVGAARQGRAAGRELRQGRARYGGGHCGSTAQVCRDAGHALATCARPTPAALPGLALPTRVPALTWHCSRPAAAVHRSVLGWPGPHAGHRVYGVWGPVAGPAPQECRGAAHLCLAQAVGAAGCRRCFVRLAPGSAAAPARRRQESRVHCLLPTFLPCWPPLLPRPLMRAACPALPAVAAVCCTMSPKACATCIIAASCIWI